LLSYSLLFPKFRWFILTTQPARALDVNPLVRWHQEMCHLSWSRSLTLLNTFLKRRIPLRLWSWYLQEKKLRKRWKKLNSYRRTMATMTTTTMTTIMRKKKKTTRLRKMKATMETMKMMRTTLL
jgi:hypothetical protein